MKKQIKKIKTERGVVAIFEIFILIVSIIAFSYIVGGQFQTVSAQEVSQCLATNNGNLIYENSVAVKVGQWSQSKINQWCLANGGSDVCGGGSNAWTLRSVDCTAQQPTPSIGGDVVRGGGSLALHDFWKSHVSARFVGQTGAVAGAEAGAVAGSGAVAGAEAGAVAGAEAGAGAAAATTGSVIGTILLNAAYAAAIYYGIKTGLQWAGVDPDLAEAAGESAAIGFIAYKLAEVGINQLALHSVTIFGFGAAGVIGIAVAIVYFLFTYEKTRYDMASFSCLPWDAPTGGQHCEKCNEGLIPCTEYRCKSLGQACELTNKGTTEELCVWVDRHDTNPPVIQPWDAVLTEDYRYSPDNTISPPDRGVNIVPEGDVNGCVAPFTPLRFGVTLDKPARCKLSPIRATSYEEMPNTFFGGSSTNKYNHSQQMSLPSLQSLASENITLENDGEFSLYVRCEDVQGNSNPAVFVFNFCVDKGPDTTPPRIVSTSISNGEPISFDQSSVDLQIYVNEPSECRWGKIDQAYESMENEMVCSTSVMEFNAQMLYMCSTTLTGLKNRVDNNFYFRCIDQPHLKGTEDEHQRNANQESYPFKLVGTQSLVLDSAGPDGVTIRDSTDVIEVKLEAKTSAGFKEGAATCSYKGFGTNNFYNEFEITGTHQHSQRLFLAAGIYKYDIQCVDRGGNSDSKEITFVVETDNMAPIVVRIFREANNLVIITDEDAMCVYDNLDCNYLFDDGVKMATQDYRTHSVAWNPERTFYIKCEDEFGNQPMPNQCSIIARPFELS